jgi:hypothetical protein
VLVLLPGAIAERGNREQRDRAEQGSEQPEESSKEGGAAVAHRGKRIRFRYQSRSGR